MAVDEIACGLQSAGQIPRSLRWLFIANKLSLMPRQLLIKIAHSRVKALASFVQIPGSSACGAQ